MYVLSFSTSRPHISLMLSSSIDVGEKKKAFLDAQRKVRLFMWIDTSFANIESELPKPQLAAVALFHTI